MNKTYHSVYIQDISRDGRKKLKKRRHQQKKSMNIPRIHTFAVLTGVSIDALIAH